MPESRAGNTQDEMATQRNVADNMVTMGVLSRTEE